MIFISCYSTPWLRLLKAVKACSGQAVGRRWICTVLSERFAWVSRKIHQMPLISSFKFCHRQILGVRWFQEMVKYYAFAVGPFYVRRSPLFTIKLDGVYIKSNSWFGRRVQQNHLIFKVSRPCHKQLWLSWCQACWTSRMTGGTVWWSYVPISTFSDAEKLKSVSAHLTMMTMENTPGWLRSSVGCRRLCYLSPDAWNLSLLVLFWLSIQWRIWQVTMRGTKP